MAKRATRQSSAVEAATEHDSPEIITISADVHQPLSADTQELPAPQDGTPPAEMVPPPPPTKTRGRKKKADTTPKPAITTRSHSAHETSSDLSRQLGQILHLLQSQQAQPAHLQPPTRARAAPDPPPAIIVQTPPAPQIFAAATTALDSRVPLSQGMNIFDHLTRKTQRRVRESSIDTINLAEFIYGFMGILLDTGIADQRLINMISFVRNIAEDSEHYSWRGTLDWALTIIDKINTHAITWASEQSIAMDRLVLSRSVSNALNTVVIPCPEYNTGTCQFKGSHTEYRFKLDHICSFCAPQGIEHAHTERVCHRKKSFLNAGQRQANSSGKGEYRQRSRHYDYDSKN